MSETDPLEHVYFDIDPTRPSPYGPDISYECLNCGEVIPSVEEARRP